MDLQGGAANLQGGGSLVVQGSTANPQPAVSPISPQPAVGSSVLQNAQSTLASGKSTLAATQPVTPSSDNSQVASLLQSTQALDQQLANKPVAPALNLNAINSSAQSAAQNTVNPLYTQYLNQYLQEESANQQAAQAQNTLNIQGEQSNEANTLAENTNAKTAAASTNALTQGNINAEQTNYQLTSGNAQNAKLAALTASNGAGGISSSGLGGQQVYEAENARNTADAAQNSSFQYQRNSSNLSTQDTFAQLAQSSLYAQTQEGEQEAQSNFNLNDYLRQAAYNDSQYKETLAASQQEAITAQTYQNEAQGIQSALNPYATSNPGQYAAGESAYAGLLSPSLSLPSVPNQSNYLTAAGSAV